MGANKVVEEGYKWLLNQLLRRHHRGNNLQDSTQDSRPKPYANDQALLGMLEPRKDEIENIERDTEAKDPLEDVVRKSGNQDNDTANESSQLKNNSQDE